MSQIALSPNASGTATFTIAAPNSNTNRTLTLPDATGTVNVSGLANEVPAGSAGAPAIYTTGDSNTGIFFPAADTVAVATAGTERMRVASTGFVGIGTTSPSEELHIYSTDNPIVLLEAGPGTDSRLRLLTANDRIGYVEFGDTDDLDTGEIRYEHSSNTMFFATNGNVDRMIINSSGNVGIGLTPSTSDPLTDVSAGLLQVNGNVELRYEGSNTDPSGARYFNIVNTDTTLVADQPLGGIQWVGLDATTPNSNMASITSYCSGNTGTTGDLRFKIAGTERARIDNGGSLLVGTTSTATNVEGHVFRAGEYASHTVDGDVVVVINRGTNDGQLIQFRQGDVQEGNINVSGTTVSYVGGHLSRWAQFPDNSRPELLKGTVMSNLDQMSNWDGEDNEQLNCVQVSTVEGDANVAGVFVAWDSTDDGYNDILLAMTGDMVIRIGAGVTVQRGDLLISAGDGTAKPQGDDIVRSKTIAKVTSTHVSHTYADGSYAVPCVLMAC